MDRVARRDGQPEALHTATLGTLPNRVRVVGVVHPGSASGGSTSAIKADFVRAIGRIRDWLQADAGWLPADPGMTRNLTASFPYFSAPIRTGTSRSGHARASVGAGRQATAATTSERSACSRQPASTTPQGPT